MAVYEFQLHPEQAFYKNSGFPNLYRADGATGGPPVEALEFADSSTQTAFWRFAAIGLTADVDTIEVTFHWFAETATSGNVVWGAELFTLENNVATTSVEALSTPLVDATVTDGHLGTTAKRMHSATVTLDVSAGRPAEDSYCVLALSRTGAVAGDTLSNSTMLALATVRYETSPAA